ncbi:MAG TPA: M23 family metallopeptidase [Vicinamibacterales bacterium]|nr:M23 family metallopeptidase [Vicinamibacterales bacterium]
MRPLALAVAVAAGLLPQSRAAAQADPIAVTARARARQPGELVVLTLVMPDATLVPRVHVFGRALLPYKVSQTTWRVLVGIDLEAAAGTYPITIDGGPAASTIKTTYSLVVAGKTFPTRKLTVDDAFVNPPPSAQDRIARDSAALANLWEHSAGTPLWSGAFVRPVPDPANSAFGTRSVYNGQPRSPHSGADFLSPAGTPVKAPNNGDIVLAEDLYFTGQTVVIDHGLGLFSLFAHLSTMKVHPGDRVKTGAVLGEVGATGRVTGAHLHWMVRVGGARIDPLSLLALLGS